MKTIYRVEILDQYNEKIDFDTEQEALIDINQKLNDADVDKDYTYTLEKLNVNDKGEDDHTRCGTILIQLSASEYKSMSLDDKQKIGLKY